MQSNFKLLFRIVPRLFFSDNRNEQSLVCMALSEMTSGPMSSVDMISSNLSSLVRKIFNLQTSSVSKSIVVSNNVRALEQRCLHVVTTYITSLFLSQPLFTIAMSLQSLQFTNFKRQKLTRLKYVSKIVYIIDFHYHRLRLRFQEVVPDTLVNAGFIFSFLAWLHALLLFTIWSVSNFKLLTRMGGVAICINQTKQQEPTNTKSARSHFHRPSEI